jgi:tetratricopeptide (TPR) repeat protein
MAGLVLLGLWREHPRVFDKKNPGSKFNTESNDELRAIKPRKIIIAFKTLGYQFVNAIIALRLGFYHKYVFLHGVSKETNVESYRIDKYFFTGIAVAALTIYTHHIGLIWFCLTIAQWCNFISFNQTISLRYTYLPNIGLTIFIASLLSPTLALILFTYYATKLIHFHKFYESEYWAIEHSCFEQPTFFYPWQNRAVHCFQNNNFHGALGNMLKANELRPNDWKITYNLVQIYMLLGNIPAAKDYYEKAKTYTIDGRDAAIGNLMKRLGDWITEIETQAKTNNNAVNIDIRRFDMQR